MTELVYTPEDEEALLTLVPRFLTRDRNTNALAIAIFHMVFMFLLAVRQAVVELTDVEQMSEEALDERAWSLGMMWYDYEAGIDKKRMWIRETEQMRRSVGTVSAIARLMNGVYANCKVEEWTQYDGEPYHFRVTVFGKADPKTEAWARSAIESAKNLRSILDGFFYSDAQAEIILTSRGATYENAAMRAGEGPA